MSRARGTRRILLESARGVGLALLLSTSLAACAGAPRHRDGPVRHDGLVARALAAPGASWVTRRVGPFHLHARHGTAAAALDTLSTLVARAYARNLAILGVPGVPGPFELVFVNTPHEMHDLTGRATRGAAQPEAGSAFFVVLANDLPAVRHEVMHLLSFAGWGAPRAPGRWIAEGIATYAGGTCHGLPLHSLAAALRRDGTLLPLAQLAAEFDVRYNLEGYLQAGSFVQFVHERYGTRVLRALWQDGAMAAAMTARRTPDQMEREWRARIASTPAPAWSSSARAIAAHGCE